MNATTLKYLKFQGRMGLTRLGLWERVESWRLRRRFQKRFIHEPDFMLFRRFEGSRGLFVDVGANIGQSALSVRAANTTCPILSFEPNPEMRFGLQAVKRLLGSSFDFRIVGLGASTTTKALHVPCVKGVPFPQYATFLRENLEDNAGLREQFRQVTGTDRYSIAITAIELLRFDDLQLDPKFVKIDVEGGELDVLQGMENALARCRPMVMTEGNACRQFLRERDYNMYVHRPDQNVLTPADAELSLNYFFVPAEQILELTRAGVILDA